MGWFWSVNLWSWFSSSLVMIIPQLTRTNWWFSEASAPRYFLNICQNGWEPERPGSLFKVWNLDINEKKILLREIKPRNHPGPRSKWTQYHWSSKLSQHLEPTYPGRTFWTENCWVKSLPGALLEQPPWCSHLIFPLFEFQKTLVGLEQVISNIAITFLLFLSFWRCNIKWLSYQCLFQRFKTKTVKCWKGLNKVGKSSWKNR